VKTGIQISEEFRNRGLTILVPVFNSAHTIDQLGTRLDKVLREMQIRYEIIFIDDGSLDTSQNELCKVNLKFDHCKIICFTRNFGQHNALLCGLRAAQYGTIVTVDDDLQHPPEEIPKLVQKLSEGYDVVYGVSTEGQHGIVRNFLTRFVKLILNSVMQVKTATMISAFRAFRTDLRNGFTDFRGDCVSIDILLSWTTGNFGTVFVNLDSRAVGKTQYTFYKLFVHTMNVVTGYSTFPLRLVSLLGIVSALIGFTVFVYVVGGYLLRGSPVQGFTLLAGSVTLFSGVILLCIGLLGEYLGRVFFGVLGRPQYIKTSVIEGRSGDG